MAGVFAELAGAKAETGLAGWPSRNRTPKFPFHESPLKSPRKFPRFKANTGPEIFTRTSC